MRKNANIYTFFFTNAVESYSITPAKHKTMNITLQIPIDEYGKIATLAAAANMPIDKYIVHALSSQKQS